MKIGDFEIGSKTFIVAELSGNHGGDYETAEHMIDLAQECGADAVKLQTYLPDDMPDKDETVTGCGCWDGWKWKDVYHRTLMPWAHQIALKSYADKKGIILFTTVCSKAAVDFLESHTDMPAYKIASWQSRDSELINCVASTGKRGIITGDIEKGFIMPPGDWVLLLKDEMVAFLPGLRESLKIPIGYSNHLSIDCAIAAVELGAVIIEQHFTLSRDSIDGQFAALPAEFGYMVREIRNLEKKNANRLETHSGQ